MTLQLAGKAEATCRQLGISPFSAIFLQGQGYRQSQNLPQAIKQFERIVVTENVVNDQTAYEIAAAHLNLGECKVLLYNDHAAAEKHYASAIDLHESCQKPSQAILADDYYHMAEALKWQGKFSQSKPYYLKAIAYKRPTKTRHYPTLADLLFHYAHLLQVSKQNKEAASMYAQATAELERNKQLDKIDPQLWLNYGDLLVAMGNYASARRIYQQAEIDGAKEAKERMSTLEHTQ